MIVAIANSTFIAPLCRYLASSLEHFRPNVIVIYIHSTGVITSVNKGHLLCQHHVPLLPAESAFWRLAMSAINFLSTNEVNLVVFLF